MRNIIGRLETLEKGKNNVNTISNNEKLLEEKFNKLEKELRETKDLLMMMILFKNSIRNNKIFFLINYKISSNILQKIYNFSV